MDGAPFRPRDRVEYLTGSGPIVVADCYAAECNGRIRWIVQDDCGGRHWASSLRRIDDSSLPLMERRWTLTL